VIREPRHPSSPGASAAREPSDPSLSERFESRDYPTLPPPFDLEEFARAQVYESDRRVAPSDRPTDPALHDPSSSVRGRRTRRAIASVKCVADRVRAELAAKFFSADYVAALALAEDLVTEDPTDMWAKDFADECRRMLERAFAGRIGSLDQVPRLAVALHSLRGRALDHQAGFLLSRVDGVSTLEVLLDVSAMPRLDALRLVAKLVDDGILRLEGGCGA
jgi:hypothetical protein